MGDAPPFVGVAVKLTLVPAQVVCEPLVMAMLTAGVTTAFTVIVMLLLLTVAGLAQVALLVITHFTISPFNGT